MTRRRFKKHSRKRRKYRKKSTKKKRRRTRRKRGGTRTRGIPCTYNLTTNNEREPIFSVNNNGKLVQFRQIMPTLMGKLRGPKGKEAGNVEGYIGPYCIKGKNPGFGDGFCYKAMAGNDCSNFGEKSKCVDGTCTNQNITKGLGRSQGTKSGEKVRLDWGMNN